MRHLIAATLAAGVLGYASAGSAFPYPYLYHEPAAGNSANNRAGAGGLYGTGGKLDHGIKCAHCHIDGAGTIATDITVTKLPSGSPTGWDDVNGADGYTPGATYRIAVALTGEHRTAIHPMMPGVRTDLNGIAATLEAADGKLAGVLVSDSGQRSDACPATYPFTNGGGGYDHQGPAGKTTVLFGDCHAALSLHKTAATSWTFDWEAPAAGTGDVTLHLGVVDGDTGGSSSLDDDVVERSFVLSEGP